MNEDLEPSGNLENMQLKQQVYEEMKNNNINADHLIEILQVDEKEQSESGPPAVLDATALEEPTAHDDIVSQYTKVSIGSCQDPNFLFLLLKNFARGKHSTIIDQVISKVDKEFSRQQNINKTLN